MRSNVPEPSAILHEHVEPAWRVHVDILACFLAMAVVKSRRKSGTVCFTADNTPSTCHVGGALPIAK